MDENPSDLTSPVGIAVEVGRDVVDQAVDAARSAAIEWRAMTGSERAAVLDRVATALLTRVGELGLLLASEEGKTLSEARSEVARAGQVFRFFAGEAVRNGGELVESMRAGVEVETRREPVGVVAAITPWNFPLAIPAWKVAPALAYGNSVLLKPAELVPSCAAALAEIIERSGAPDGVFSLLLGRGDDVGEALVAHRGVDAVTFTGSVAVGERVRQIATARGARVQLEMGGKNPLVVLDDADVDAAVECAVQGAFFSTGQRCTATSRLIVTPGIHDEFVRRLAAASASLRVGHAAVETTDIGPVVDECQFNRDIDYIRVGIDEGARVVAGGDAVRISPAGWFLRPTVFLGAHNDMRLCREEIFGPIVAVIRVDDYEEAVEIANDTRFGLCAGLCTRSLARAGDFKRRADAGMIMVNVPTAGVDYHVGFGGRKDSSYGPREQGTSAREFYTQQKTVYVRAGDGK